VHVTQRLLYVLERARERRVDLVDVDVGSVGPCDRTDLCEDGNREHALGNVPDRNVVAGRNDSSVKNRSRSAALRTEHSRVVSCVEISSMMMDDIVKVSTGVVSTDHDRLQNRHNR